MKSDCLAGFFLSVALSASAQLTSSEMTEADAFVCTGSANYENGADLRGLNFGGAGTLVIAPAGSAQGEFQSVIRFNLTNAIGLFNTNFGAGHWIITNISLELTSNWGQDGAQPNNPIFNPIHGGQFVIEWMADNSWVEGTGTPNLPTADGISYNTLPSYLIQPHIPLCTNTYVPPGANVHLTWTLPLQTNLVAAVLAGGDVSFYFYAADEEINYLFNSYKYGRGNEPLIHITAVELLKWTSASWTNNAFQLTGLGIPGTNYQVQASSELPSPNWQTLGSVEADTNGLIRFLDSTPRTNTARFYRLAQ